MRLLKALILATTLLGASAGTALAQTGPDYVFNVPVRIENAPPLAGHPAAVECSLSMLQDGRIARAGSARSNFDIGAGGFRGSVRVEVTLLPGVRRADVRDYTCTLWFYSVTNAAGARTSWGSPNTLAALPGYRLITGQEVRSHVESVGGTIAR